MNIKRFLISKYKDNKELAHSFKWRLLQILFKQGTTALMFFIATYVLSKRDMGVYNYISSVLLLLALITDFGISTATSRYVTLYNTQDKRKVKKIFFNSSILIFTISILVVGTILFFRDKLFLEIYSEYLLYALPMVFIFPMTSLMDGIYRGLKKFKKLALLTIVNSAVGISASYFLVTTLGLLGAVISPLVFFTSYLLLLVTFYKGYSFKLEKKILKDIVGYSFFFGIAALGHYFFSKVNILILGSYDLLEEIAVYELLNKINNEFILPFIVLGTVLAPNVVEMFSLKKYVNIRKLFKRFLLLTILFGVLFVPVSMFLSSTVIDIVFPIYSGEVLGTILLPITLTYAIVIPVVVINTGMITSTGHASLMAIQNVVSGVVNVGLNILVISTYGYVGVVWVTFFVQLLSTVILYIVYYSKLKRLG